MKPIFRILIVGILMGSMLVALTPNAYAVTGPYTRTKTTVVTGTHPIVNTLGIGAIIAKLFGLDVTLGTSTLSAKWYIKNAAECGSLYPCFYNVTWGRTYQNGVFELDHWLKPSTRTWQNATGVWSRVREQAAQFKWCFIDYGVHICYRFTVYNQITIRTNGTSDATSWVT